MGNRAPSCLPLQWLRTGTYHLYWKEKLRQEGAGGEEPGDWEEVKGEEQEEAKMIKTEKP